MNDAHDGMVVERSFEAGRVLRLSSITVFARLLACLINTSRDRMMH
jgi:hypothetical protein